MKINEVMTPANSSLIYVDMDGVIADFAAGVQQLVPEWTENTGEQNRQLVKDMWNAITRYQRGGGRFWFELQPLPDASVLWNYIKKNNPQILSAAGNPQYHADEQKRRWIAKYFGRNVRVNIVRMAKEKAQFAAPGAILIDDKSKAIDPWIAAGGIGILHTSAANTIQQLKELGI